MIVKDMQPAYMVEREGFCELMNVLEPRYTVVSRKHLQHSLLPGYHSKVADRYASGCSLAFSGSLPGFQVELDSDEDDLDDDDDDDQDEQSTESDDDVQLDEIEIPQRISCFAHTLQLTIKDGLKSCKQISSVLTKASLIVNHVRKSTIATGKMETLYGKTLIAKHTHRRMNSNHS